MLLRQAQSPWRTCTNYRLLFYPHGPGLEEMKNSSLIFACTTLVLGEDWEQLVPAGATWITDHLSPETQSKKSSYYGLYSFIVDCLTVPK